MTRSIHIGKNELNRVDFLYKLTSSKASIEKVTLIPGETSEIFFKDIAKDMKLDNTKLKKYYNKLINSFSPL